MWKNKKLNLMLKMAVEMGEVLDKRTRGVRLKGEFYG